MRSPVQPLRRNSALYRVYDDLILWLKFENNFEDSSFFYQETSGLSPDVVPPNYIDYQEGSYTLPDHYENRIDLPSFDGGRYKSEPYSAYFGSGQQFIQEGLVVCKMAPCPQLGHYLSGCSVMVSGTGVYTTAPDFDSAAEFDLEDDFTIEFYAQFSGIPNSPEPSTLFDFGNLKLTNTSGFFSIETPDGGVLDYYDHDFVYPESSSTWAPTLTNTWTHYAVQRRDDRITFWMGSRDQNGVDNNPFMIRAEDPDGGGLVSGNRDDPYRSCRTIGSTISGTNFFSGWIDEFKVWKRAIYGPEPICTGGPDAKGIYVTPNWREVFRTPAQTAAILAQDWAIPKQEVHYIRKGQDPSLWCRVRTVYDPRYSVHEPLPWEIEWYKGGVRLGASSNGIFGTNAEHVLKKYPIGTLGLGDLIVRNFEPSDEGWYYAVVKMGPPNRPKYQWAYPQIVRQYLKYLFIPPPCPYAGTWPYCSCFGKDTKVLMHDKTEKKIFELLRGDRVYSFDDEEEEVTKSIVTNVEENKADSYHELVVNDRTLKVTDDHPIYVGEGQYKSAKDLEVNDLVSIFDNGKLIQAPIQSKKKIEKRIDVYNLSVDSDKTFFVNGVAVHNKSPQPRTYLRLTGCPGVVPLGGSATLRAQLLGGRINLPVTFNWTNVGRGTIYDGGYYQTYTLTNIRKSLKGDVCASAIDANGVAYGPSCCAIKVRLPALQCPLVTGVEPNTSNKDLTITYPWYNWGGGSYRSSYCQSWIRMSIVPDEPNFSINFRVHAVNDAPVEMNAGGLRYDWWMTGMTWGTWVGGIDSSAFSMYFTENTNTQIYCRVSYANYPPGVRTQDPEGGYQYGPQAITRFYVNFPDCVEPVAFMTYNYYGRPYRSRSGHKASTRSAAGLEHHTEERTVYVYNCTEDYEISISFLGKDPGGNCSTYRKNRNEGFARNFTIGDGIEIDGNYKSYKINKAPNYCGYNSYDVLTIKKDLFKDNDGDTITVKFNNDCGDRTIKVNFKIYAEPNASLYAFGNNRWVTNAGSNEWNVNFYKQVTEVYNWLGNLVSSSERSYPFSVVQYISQQPYRSAGCMYWQMKVDGKIVVPWASIGGGGYGVTSYYNGGVTVNLPRYPSGGYSAINFYSNRTAWPNNLHKVVIQIRNNLTSPDPETGAGTDTTWNVKFIDLPKITSYQRAPYWGWWWYCGSMYYGSRRLSFAPGCYSYWWRPWNWYYNPWRRYYWPYYRPWYYYRTYTPYYSRRSPRLSFAPLRR